MYVNIIVSVQLYVYSCFNLYIYVTSPHIQPTTIGLGLLKRNMKGNKINVIYNLYNRDSP